MCAHALFRKMKKTTLSQLKNRGSVYISRTLSKQQVNDLFSTLISGYASAENIEIGHDLTEQQSNIHVDRHISMGRSVYFEVWVLAANLSIHPSQSPRREEALHSRIRTNMA